MAYSAKVQKFIIIPVASIYQDEDLVREDRMKPILAFSGTKVDLKSLSKEMENKVNERFTAELNKLEKANGRGSSTDREDSGDEGLSTAE